MARAIGSFEYQPVRGRFRDWLGAVTRNRIIRFLEGRRDLTAAGDDLAGLLEVPSEDPGWAAEFHARIPEAALARVRPGFEPTTWDAFARVWLRDRPAPEVARELGMTVDAVYAVKSRVLRRLREEVLMLAKDLPWLTPRS